MKSAVPMHNRILGKIQGQIRISNVGKVPRIGNDISVVST